MLLVSCCSLVITALFLSTETTGKSLEFDDCLSTNYLTEDDKYYMNWSGESRSYPCKVQFRSSGVSLDEYKICIKATTWKINDADVSLKYYTSESSWFYTEKEIYNLYSSPTDEWCSESGDYVAVQLETNYYGNNQGEIVLAVYTKKIDYSAIVGAIVGGVIGGVVLISIIITIVVVIACRRRRGNAGSVLTNPASSGNVIVSQTGQQAQGQWNTGYSAPQSFGSQPYSPAQAGQWNMGYSTPQHYGNAMSQPSAEVTTGGESFNPPPYSSVTGDQQAQKQ